MAITEIHITNDEIEVVCDLLWFIKRQAELPVVAEALWQRLQPIRRGDFGGTAQTALSADEARAAIELADLSKTLQLDEDEAAVIARLRSLLDCSTGSRPGRSSRVRWSFGHWDCWPGGADALSRPLGADGSQVRLRRLVKRCSLRP